MYFNSICVDRGFTSPQMAEARISLEMRQAKRRDAKQEKDEDLAENDAPRADPKLA
jgi:hypothetical protein